MLKQSWVIFLCLASGIAGLLQHWQKVNAAGGQVPAACPEYQCKNVSYYWSGNAQTIVGYTEAGKQNLAVQGWLNIFAATSTNQKPNKTTNNFVDSYTYAACTPSCGKDSNGVWQAPQEVSPSGNPTPLQQGIAQFACANMPPGQTGPIVDPPVNGNDQKNAPPGWGG